MPASVQEKVGRLDVTGKVIEADSEQVPHHVCVRSTLADPLNLHVLPGGK